MEIFLSRLKKNSLRDFIFSLLGKPRSLSKSWTDLFVMDHQFIINIGHTLDQRLSQNNAIVTSFSSTISYNDGREQRLGSWDDFCAYNDTSYAKSVSVSLTWVYLVKFPGRNIPEKQGITIEIETARNRITKVDAADYICDYMSTFLNRSARIRVVIDYTELTWGNDILHLIENTLRQSFISEYIVFPRIREVTSGLIGPFMPIVMLLFLVLPWDWLKGYAVSTLRAEILSKIQTAQTEIERVSLKLDFANAANLVNINTFLTKYVVITLSVEITMLFKFLLILSSPKSFLILNSYTKRKYDNSQKTEQPSP